MSNPKSPAQLKPLIVGRVTRVLFGMASFVVIGVLGPDTLTIWGAIGLGALGASFVVGGVVGNPGCEITAIPNLFVPARKRTHCT